MESQLKIPTDTEWDELRSLDLCYNRVEGFPRSFGKDVLGEIAPRVLYQLDVNRLAGYMRRKGAIGDPQYRRLIKPHCTREQRANQLQLVLSSAIWDEDPSQFVKDFYLALCDLYENDGQRNHYELAQFLRGKVLASLQCGAYDRVMKELTQVLGNVPSVTLPEEQAYQLRHSLGLAVSIGQGNLQVIVAEWQKQCRKARSTDLVRALMITPGLGRYVSGLVPYCLANCPKVRVFIGNLMEEWQLLAEYMGYTRQEVQDMLRNDPTDRQFQVFLRVWRMPDCDGSEDAILDETLRQILHQGAKNRADEVAVIDPRHIPQRSSSGTEPAFHGKTNLFAPRPKTPPPAIPQASSSSSGHVTTLQVPDSMTRSVVEVLHEFAQFMISAAVGERGHEWLIDKAVITEYSHLIQFFFQYINDPAGFAGGGSVVSEFIGGSPSPLNFLLTSRLVTKADFQGVLETIGRLDFPQQLLMALHEMPGSDHLPYDATMLMDSLFNQTIRFGSGVTNVSSYQSSSPPVSPTPPPSSPPPSHHRISASAHPTTQTQLNFRSTGGYRYYRLGRGEETSSPPTSNYLQQTHGSLPSTMATPPATSTGSRSESHSAVQPTTTQMTTPTATPTPPVRDTGVPSARGAGRRDATGDMEDAYMSNVIHEDRPPAALARVGATSFEPNDLNVVDDEEVQEAILRSYQLAEIVSGTLSPATSQTEQPTVESHQPEVHSAPSPADPPLGEQPVGEQQPEMEPVTVATTSMNRESVPVPSAFEQYSPATVVSSTNTPAMVTPDHGVPLMSTSADAHKPPPAPLTADTGPQTSLPPLSYPQSAVPFSPPDEHRHIPFEAPVNPEHTHPASLQFPTDQAALNPPLVSSGVGQFSQGSLPHETLVPYSTSEGTQSVPVASLHDTFPPVLPKFSQAHISTRMAPRVDVPMSMDVRVDVSTSMGPRVDVPTSMGPRMDVLTSMGPRVDIPTSMDARVDVPTSFSYPPHEDQTHRQLAAVATTRGPIDPVHTVHQATSTMPAPTTTTSQDTLHHFSKPVSENEPSSGTMEVVTAGAWKTTPKRQTRKDTVPSKDDDSAERPLAEHDYQRPVEYPQRSPDTSAYNKHPENIKDEVERRQEASSEQNAGPSSHEEVHVPSIDRDEIRLGAHEETFPAAIQDCSRGDKSTVLVLDHKGVGHQMNVKHAAIEVVKAKITVRIEQEGVLSVEAGETFQVLEKMETWWRVKRMENDEEGLVPAFCMPSESPTETSTVTVSEVVKANRTFTSEQPGELSVAAGETLQVLNKRDMWWLVKRVENDEKGLVPAVYMHSEPPTGMSMATMSDQPLLPSSLELQKSEASRPQEGPVLRGATSISSGQAQMLEERHRKCRLVFQRLLKQFASQATILEVKRCGRSLGEGAFGRVMEIECVGYDRTLAAKIIKVDNMGECDEDIDAHAKRFCMEYTCLAKLNVHRNIVRYIGLCLDRDCDFPVLVMELMTCNFHSFLLASSNRNLSEKTKIMLLYEIARGLQYLHKNFIIHRDLTAKNVLMDKKNTPKISDFGNSCLIATAGATSYVGTRTGNVGTLNYMAPEVNSSSARYNKKVDVFSFGHLALFACLQEFPKDLLPPRMEVRGKLESRTEVERRMKYFQKLPPDSRLTQFMKECLDDLSDRRPSSSELKAELRKLKVAISTSRSNGDS